MQPEICTRLEAGGTFPALVWRFARPLLTISSGPFGGGLGVRHWILNATVPADYDRPDPNEHLTEVAHGLGLAGAGIGLLTAVDVGEHVTVGDEGTEVVATVGIGNPEWAAADAGAPPRHWSDAVHRVGTINLVVFVPQRLSPAALVNAVATATEAKVQAFADLGIHGSGTATDAVVVTCPTEGDEEPYGGPRSAWGSRLARAVHRSVVTGALADPRLAGRVLVPGAVTTSGVTLDG